MTDRLNAPNTLTMLRPRHYLIVDRLIHGLPRNHAAFPDLEPHVPLLPKQVAAVLGCRVRYVNRLLREPIVLAEVNKQIAALRNGAKAKAVAKMVELVDWKGAGQAADATVALKASQSVLGEEAKGLTVNVGVTNNLGVTVRPGYIIRQPEQRTAPMTIEGRAESID